MSTRTAIVTGASRGFGRATAIALVNAGVHVIGVARDREQLDAVRHEAGAEFTPVAADAADPLTAGRLIDTYHPDILILNAGAQPLASAYPQKQLGDIQHQLGGRRPPRIQLDARGTPGAPGPGERGRCCLQRCRTYGVLDRRRILRSQGNHPVHDRIRRRGIEPGEPRHQIRYRRAWTQRRDSSWTRRSHRTCQTRRRFTRQLLAAPRSHTYPRASRSGNRRPGNWTANSIPAPTVSRPTD